MPFLFYVLADHLGSPRKISNQVGAVVWAWAEQPFGDVAANQDPDGDGIVFDYNLRFPGQFFDRETGLYYNFHRYYDAQTGRYITSDPIGLNGGLNTYGYVGGNPLKYTDFTGLWVSAVLDTQTNTLIVTDTKTNVSIGTSAFTGGHADEDGSITSPGFPPREIPAPKGTYWITDNPNPKPGHEDWYGLIAQDERIDDYSSNGDRSGIRLHLGQTSWGCVTANIHAQDGEVYWEMIKDLINNTHRTTLDFRTGPHWYNGTRQLNNYGTLTIK